MTIKVQYLSEGEIEKEAALLLAEYAETTGAPIKLPVPIDEIATFHLALRLGLTIEADHCTPARIKLGEAKIYSSPSYNIKGIGQLLGRYTTGRETPGLLINYVRKPDIKAIMAKLKTEMDKKLPENQTGPCGDHALKWSLLTRHKHSSGGRFHA